MSDPDRHQQLDCPDCHATPRTGDAHIITAGAAGTTEIWHTDDCPQHTLDQILQEDSARHAEEREAQTEAAFTAALDRLKVAAGSVTDEAVTPFTAALTELAEAHGDPDRFLTRELWVEILERHFPPPA